MKAALDDFAVAGGAPAFAEPLHVGRPNVGSARALQERIATMLERRWVTNDGPFVREFEARVADGAGVAECVAVSNGTKALEILVRAAGLEGEVIVPSFTFVGTAHAMLWSGLTPRFCDVDARTHTLDPECAERLVGPATSAIVGVHLWGRSCRVAELEAVAERHGLKLFFDAAHAYASSAGGRPLGSFGAAAIYSFHGTKLVQAGEGGAIVTDDRELADRARLLRNFGFRDYDDVVALGTNGKMSELSAAMGLTSLDALEGFLEANRQNHDAYAEGLAGLAGIELVPQPEGDAWNHQYVVLEVDPDAAGLSRDDLHRVLWAEGVLARRYFYPGAHAMEPYRTLDEDAGRALPVTERLVERVLCLPTGTAVGPREIEVVCGIVRAAVAQSEDLRGRLAAAP